jgi:hypothetical protein
LECRVPADVPPATWSNDERRSRRELAITLTEDSAMAAAAMIGESSSPKAGSSTPAGGHHTSSRSFRASAIRG